MVFKNWSFRLFIYVILLNILVVFLYDPTQLLSIGLLATVILILGLIFGIMSFVNKEQSDYKKYIGFIGNLILLVIGILASISDYLKF